MRGLHMVMSKSVASAHFDYGKWAKNDSEEPPMPISPNFGRETAKTDNGNLNKAESKVNKGPPKLQTQDTWMSPKQTQQAEEVISEVDEERDESSPPEDNANVERHNATSEVDEFIIESNCSNTAECSVLTPFSGNSVV